MIRLSSIQELLAALAAARQVTADAYTLHGPVLRGLEAAARRGAQVEVHLEGDPFGADGGALARENAKVAGFLRAAGARAELDHPMHAKAVEIDGTLFLDEKNFAHDDVVLRADAARDRAAIATRKSDALAQEASLLDASDGDVVVETESFSAYNKVSAALERLGRAGKAPRLLVCDRVLRHNAKERAALERLAADGVRVRICSDSEKLALADGRAWLGSANATVAFGASDMPDWGTCSTDSSIVKAVKERIERNWSNAKRFA